MKTIRCVTGEDIKIENGIAWVARSRHKITLPERKDSELAYLTGYHFGDGYLDDVEKALKKRCKGRFEICFSDSCEEMLQIIGSLVKKKFNITPSLRRRTIDNLYLLRINSKVMHWYFNTELEIPIRHEKISIPKWITKNRKNLKQFISGFFDAEGFIFKENNGSVRLGITQKDKDFLEQLKQILQKKFNIKFPKLYKKFNQNGYELKTGSKKTIEIFKQTFDIRHPKKLNSLSNL